jgi:hypothetical protein
MLGASADWTAASAYVGNNTCSACCKYKVAAYLLCQRTCPVLVSGSVGVNALWGSEGLQRTTWDSGYTHDSSGPAGMHKSGGLGTRGGGCMFQPSWCAMEPVMNIPDQHHKGRLASSSTSTTLCVCTVPWLD